MHSGEHLLTHLILAIQKQNVYLPTALFVLVAMVASRN